MLKVVFFGGLGHFSAAHLGALAGQHQIVGVFRDGARQGARPRIGGWLRAAGLRPDPVAAAARAHGVPCWRVPPTSAALVERLQTVAPDVVCVAGYPRRLPSEACAVAPLGAFNVHGALLPRHRGVLPLFWIYYRNDADTGVTVHRVTDRLDAGEIVAQDVFRLARGFPVESLNQLNTERGCALLLRTLEQADGGRLTGQPQDDALATTAPAIRPGTPMVDFTWDVERVWHFLAGLLPWFREPLRGQDGIRLPYDTVLNYERRAHGERPGVARGSAGDVTLFCEGGVVRLSA